MLPEAERIYYKDFHFLDEPLIDRQNRKEPESEKLLDNKPQVCTSENKITTQGGSAVSTAAGSSTMIATKGSVGGG